MPIQSSPVKRITKRPVGRPPKAKKARIEVEFECVVKGGVRPLVKPGEEAWRSMTRLGFSLTRPMESPRLKCKFHIVIASCPDN